MVPNIVSYNKVLRELQANQEIDSEHLHSLLQVLHQGGQNQLRTAGRQAP